jgi:exopolysaccharide biosynthesis WecB/TagA/CpsF family protein
MRADIPALTILGVPVARLAEADALTEATELLAAEAPALLAYANAHTLNVAVGNGRFRTVLRDADLLLNDGSGLAIAARLRGAEFPANLNGTDFTPRLLAAADAPVFLYGGRPGVAETASRNLAERIPGLRVTGTAHGYLDPAGQAGLAAKINASGARILLVGLGNPKQELWLADHLAETGAGLGVAVGAFLDFAAGEVRRAPAWMRRLGVEWIYRLVREPGRLFRRYIVGNPLFLARVLTERFIGSPRR